MVGIVRVHFGSTFRQFSTAIIKGLVLSIVLFVLSGAAWAADPNGLTLYGRVQGGVPIAGGTQIPGENIDLRKGALSWETLDVVVPGNGGLDIEIYRQFMSNERIERAMEDWSLSLPRITMGTNPGGSTKFDLGKAQYESSPGICEEEYNANVDYTAVGLRLAVYNLLNDQNGEYTGLAALVVVGLIKLVVFEAFKRDVEHSTTVRDSYTGLQLTIPGKGTRSLLRNNNEALGEAASSRFQSGKAINARYVTTDNWLVECANDSSGKKNNFIVYSPDGKKYTFDVLSKAIGDPILAEQIGQYVWYPSRVEDRFANNLKFNYAYDTYLCWGWDTYLEKTPGASVNLTPTCPRSAKLTKITASDGREVQINYERPSALVPKEQRTMNDHGGRRVSSVVAEGRTWKYRYGKSHTTFSNYLSEVELPDGTTWKFTKYPGTKGGIPFMANDWARHFGWLRRIDTLAFEQDSYNGLKADGTPGGTSIINRILGLMESVTTPLGTRIVYDYATFDAAYFRDTTSTKNKVFSVTSRSVSGPGINATNTSYAYSYNSSLQEGTTTITLPAASNGDIPKVVHSFDLTPDSDHFGLPVRNEVFANDVLVKKTETDYVTLASIGEPRIILESPRAHYVMRAVSNATVTNEDGNVYGTKLDDFDTFGGPKSVVETGKTYRSYVNSDGGQVVAPTRTSRLSYFSNPDNWIVGLPEDETVVANGGGSGNVVSDKTYNPNGTLKSTTQNNITVGYTYTTKGDLNTIKWKTSGVAYSRTLESYKNGTPQTEKGPEGTIRRIVNGFGEVTEQTNARNVRVAYGRDAMGRVSSTDHQDFTGSFTDWNFNGNARLRRETIGNVQKLVQTDSFGNEISVQSTDLITGITTYQVKRYDNYANLIFESNKSYSPDPVAGVRYQYDVLNRKVYLEDQNNNIVRNCYSVSCVPVGAPFAGWDLSGYQVNVETIELPGGGDESGSLTQDIVNISASVAFGNPDNADVAGIFTKEKETNDANRYSATLFERTLSGQPIKIAQGGGRVSDRVVRGFEYYSNTTQVRYEDNPDLGRTELQYDESGNIRRKVVNGGVAVSFIYDYGNRILYEDYPNDKGTPDVSYAYDPNGNLRWLDNGYSRMSYEYNTADLVEDVTYDIGGLKYFLDYEWNSDKTLNALVYPDSERADFAPNGYGVPTSVSRYARYATYHPSGYIESFEYGNGVNYQIGVNDYNMPSDFEVRNPGNALIAQEVYRHNFRKQIYAVDKRLGVGAALVSESYKYTPSNYLSSGANQLGPVSYTYDSFGNLRTKQENGETLTMTYRGLAAGSQGTRVNTIASSKGTNYTYAYDGLGNVTGNGKHTFGFDNASRMASVSNLGITYIYDGRGHRIAEKSGTETKITLRTEKGQVLYQHNLTQNKAYKYYRLGSLLVAESEDPCTVNCNATPIFAARTADADHGVDEADVYINQSAATVTGTQVAYSLLIGNEGPQTASNVEFRHAIPAGAFGNHSISRGNCSPSGLDMVCLIGKLAPGETVTFNGSVTGLSLDDYTKTAVSRVISSTTDPDTSNNALVHKSGGGGTTCTSERAAAGTVAVGSLDVLRGYRDNVLANSQYGPEIIAAYYRSSPDLVQAMDGHGWFLHYMRGMLGIFFVIAWIGLSPLQWMGLLGAFSLVLAALLIIKRKNMMVREARI